MLDSDKHSSLFGPILSYEENGVLWTQPQAINTPLVTGTFVKVNFVNFDLFEGMSIKDFSECPSRSFINPTSSYDKFWGATTVSTMIFNATTVSTKGLFATHSA